MKKHIKRQLKKISTINLAKVKSILKTSKKALILEQKKNMAHLRWLADFRIRHKFDIRNKALFKKYLGFTKKLKKFEIKHAKLLLPIRH